MKADAQMKRATRQGSVRPAGLRRLVRGADCGGRGRLLLDAAPDGGVACHVMPSSPANSTAVAQEYAAHFQIAHE